MLAVPAQHELAGDGRRDQPPRAPERVGAKQQAEREAGDQRASEPRVAAKTDYAGAGELRDDRATSVRPTWTMVRSKSRMVRPKRSSPARTAI